MPSRIPQIYLSYADGDERFRDQIIAQAKNTGLGANFVHMPTKNSWTPQWKATCRSRIFQADAAIALITGRILQAEGTKAELQFVNEAQLPLLGVYMDQYQGSLPPALKEASLVQWNWAEVSKFIKSLA